jgi:hypothetical protein
MSLRLPDVRGPVIPARAGQGSDTCSSLSGLVEAGGVASTGLHPCAGAGAALPAPPSRPQTRLARLPSANSPRPRKRCEPHQGVSDPAESIVCARTSGAVGHLLLHACLTCALSRPPDTCIAPRLMSKIWRAPVSCADRLRTSGAACNCRMLTDDSPLAGKVGWS